LPAAPPIYRRRARAGRGTGRHRRRHHRHRRLRARRDRPFGQPGHRRRQGHRGHRAHAAYPDPGGRADQGALRLRAGADGHRRGVDPGALRRQPPAAADAARLARPGGAGALRGDLRDGPGRAAAQRLRAARACRHGPDRRRRQDGRRRRTGRGDAQHAGAPGHPPARHRPGRSGRQPGARHRRRPAAHGQPDREPPPPPGAVGRPRGHDSQPPQGLVPRRLLGGAHRGFSQPPNHHPAQQQTPTREDTDMANFELVENMAPNAVIKVIGVGGGGGNAVAHMVSNNVDGVEFITANTDSQAIKNCGAKLQLQLGDNVTKGLGAGANPEVGRQAALEDRERLMDAMEGADMVFITAGMGGGTGTGAAPVVAQLAKEMGILTVAVVTKPFPFEGRRRMQVALKGIEELGHHVDSLITIPNEKLITVLGRNATMIQAFRAANYVLLGDVQGVADVRTVMSEMGLAMMGTGAARGDDRAQAAAEAAVQNPLLDDVNLSGANGILVNITAGPDFTMAEFDEVGRTVDAFASEDATVVIGTVLDPDMQDEVKVTVVATGLNRGVARNSRGNETRAPIQLVRNGTTGQAEMVEDDAVATTGHTPSFVSNLRSSAPAPAPEPAVAAADFGSDNYLDIPAFLRRQAD